MKKFTLGIICGLIIAIGITVFAVILSDAYEIPFVPKNETWNVGNVGDAINDLNNSYVSKSKLDDTVWEFNYNGTDGSDGSYQVFEAVTNGVYQIELWGAQGGSYSTAIGGLGAYTSGLIKLTRGYKLYIYVGGAGYYTPSGVEKYVAGGWNGGGSTGGQACCERNYGSGGGATDVRLKSGDWDNLDSLTSRIMVAAGGGGAFYDKGSYGPDAGGDGGALRGLNGQQKGSQTYCYGEGASQTSGGYITTNCSSNIHNGESINGLTGSFGKGGEREIQSTGGGGGYYGGSRSGHVAGAGGGSSYISGYTGCIAVAEEGTTTKRTGTNDAECKENTTDNLCSIHYSGLKFTSPTMIAGNAAMPANFNNTKKTGNAGHGFAKITLVSID